MKSKIFILAVCFLFFICCAAFAGSFTGNGNGTITDNLTDLMWQKCSTGQNNDDACSGAASTYNWYQATGTADAIHNPRGNMDVCGTLTLGGHTDWRLPSMEELESIIDGGTHRPVINTTYFPNTDSSFYWSSTTHVTYYDPAFAMSVSFYNGGRNDGGKHGDKYVRCVRFTLYTMDERINQLIADIKNKDSDIRERAVKALSEIKDARAVKPLTIALKDNDINVRREAANALCEIKDSRAVGSIITALNDRDIVVRGSAITALGIIKDIRAVEPLIALLASNSEATVREKAAYALGKIKDRRASKPLVAALKDRFAIVGGAAAYALGEIKDPNTVKPLVAAAIKPHNEFALVGDSARESLVKIGAPSLAPLAAALTDKDPRVRWKAVYIISTIKEPRAVELLTKALKDPNDEVQEEAQRALKEIEEQNSSER